MVATLLPPLRRELGRLTCSVGDAKPVPPIADMVCRAQTISACRRALRHSGELNPADQSAAEAAELPANRLLTFASERRRVLISARLHPIREK